ncbi:MAG: 30S ribosomal protein S27e [Candidatus Odinarchaeia archaeon]
MVKEIIPQPKSKFLRVKCLDCNSEQIIFGCASTVVKCEVCGKVLAEPSGGKAKIRTRIISVLT